jgi:hypothetical protein
MVRELSFRWNEEGSRMVALDGIVEPAALGRWSEALEELHGRIAHRFARSEARERVQYYLLGLLGRIERKNAAGRWSRPWASPIHRAFKGC